MFIWNVQKWKIKFELYVEREWEKIESKLDGGALKMSPHNIHF